MFFQSVGQPDAERHFFSVLCSDEVRLTGQQTLRGREPNKIFRRFDFFFKVLVLRFDVIDRFLRRVGLSISNESRIRIGDVIEKVINRVVQRFRG